MKTLKKRLGVVLVLSAALTLPSFEVYAGENIADESVTTNNVVTESSIEKNVSDSITEYNYTDKSGGLVSTTEINTFATNRVLWNKSYTKQNSVKKEINAKNYGVYAKPGKVNVSIKNTGNNTIIVNIYQSWWNSKTIAYGKIAPGSSKTFTIGPEQGGYDSHANNVFAYQRFTISTYAKSGEISFNGYAKIFY